ncbi:MAG: dTDP-4-dehydrorhamnose 3,5-epimerase family protein, partial [Spartobacteria bacterium]
FPKHAVEARLPWRRSNGTMHSDMPQDIEEFLMYPATERSLRWNDPAVGIDWPLAIGIDPVVSPKDAEAASFAQCEKYP